FVGAKLQLDCGPSVGTFVGTIVDVSDEKLTLKNALRNGLPSDTGLVTLHRSSIVSITMLRSPGEQASDSTVSTASTTLQQVKDKENKIDHRVIEASLQEKTQQQQQQQQARREAARERLMSIPNATPVYICQNSPICPGKGGGGSGGNGQNGRHKGSEASKPKGINSSGDLTTSNGRSNKDRNLPVSPTGRRQVNSGGNPATHQHVRARSELVTNYISCVNNSIGATNNTTSSSSPTMPNGIAVDQSGSTVWFLANGDSDLRVPAVSDHFLETVLLAAEKLGLSMARMAECCGRSVADFLVSGASYCWGAVLGSCVYDSPIVSMTLTLCLWL
uniref:LSM14 domain-containing protein n=1 Tax=Macrostomum lignano TaxID=282301 RepID=A0A1I8GDP4_9PLAT